MFLNCFNLFSDNTNQLNGDIENHSFLKINWKKI